MINIRNAVLSSLNAGAFGSFLNAITNTELVNFGLHGTANGELIPSRSRIRPLLIILSHAVTARTAAGDVPIGGIPFDVKTSFSGLQGFGGVAKIPEIPLVTGSGGGDPFNPSAGGSDFLV